ncbi:TPA: site-specific integrase [Pseudomonas aeruginosa]|nr:site-specific integrase [Pseudomonas aeruginosa]HCH7673127.1 site-specific integrase [Pseudomonas aeruginosa]HCH9723985.1 site-specific integrase [Pseudomonas aeruginosa]HCI3167837.1 site-specific integrase [Pseudomonas aeruginosa]HCI3557975.1 site-specific integrase [Pseudomonas aeruginosa]
MTCQTLRSSATPKALTGWVLLDDYNLPRYWATVWADVLQAKLKGSTRSQYLYAIDRLYQHFAQLHHADVLDQLLTDCQYDALEAGLSAFLNVLRNQAKRDDIVNSKVWASAIRFVIDILRYLARDIDAVNLKGRLANLDKLYSQLDPTPPAEPVPIRALPGIVVDDLYRIMGPLSPDNPFRTEKNRWRNYFVFICALASGLRRGEVASLPSDAIQSEYDYAVQDDKNWISVRENPYVRVDPRREAPGIKNSQSRRQLPISQDMLKANDRIVGDFTRNRLHSYLIGSQKGKPISLRQLQRVFEVASSQLSPASKRALHFRGKNSVTLHDLRHTCAVYRLKRYLDSGIDLDTAVEKLRVFFGWSANSEMPRHYARAYFESSHADVWSDNYEKIVSTLRDLDGEHEDV